VVAHLASNRGEQEEQPFHNFRILIDYAIVLLSLQRACVRSSRSGNESCHLDRHLSFGVATADLLMIGPGRLDNRRIEVKLSEI
jgi:hypothetical protein